MPVEVGQIMKGTITGVKKFGAFIKLPDGSTGLCHISEVSNGFVKDIEIHLSVDQEVEVKVIGIDKDGKINLSIKQTQKNVPVKQPYKKRSTDNRFRPKPEPAKDFESLVVDFMKVSDEKLRSTKSAKSRRSNGYNSKK